MKDIRLYYSDLCERSKRVLAYMEEKNIEGPRLMDASRDIDLQVEIYKLGGKSEVPMLYMDGRAIYDEEEIIGELDKI